DGRDHAVPGQRAQHQAELRLPVHGRGQPRPARPHRGDGGEPRGTPPRAHRVPAHRRGGAPALEQALSDERAELARYPWLPRLFVLESEYQLMTQEAELAWLRGIV